MGRVVAVLRLDRPGRDVAVVALGEAPDGLEVPAARGEGNGHHGWSFRALLGLSHLVVEPHGRGHGPGEPVDSDVGHDEVIVKVVPEELAVPAKKTGGRVSQGAGQRLGRLGMQLVESAGTRLSRLAEMTAQAGTYRPGSLRGASEPYLSLERNYSVSLGLGELGGSPSRRISRCADRPVEGVTVESSGRARTKNFLSR